MRGDLAAPVPQQPVAIGVSFEKDMRDSRHVTLPEDIGAWLQRPCVDHGLQQVLRAVEICPEFGLTGLADACCAYMPRPSLIPANICD